MANKKGASFNAPECRSWERRKVPVWGYFCYDPKGKNYDVQLIWLGSCQTVLFFGPGKDSVTRLSLLACVRY